MINPDYILMELLILSPLQTISFAELQRFALAGGLSNNSIRSISKRMERISHCKGLRFFAVTDGFLISAVGVAFDQFSDHVKSGWLMRAYQLMKVSLRDVNNDNQNLSIVPFEFDTWNAFPHCLIGTTSSIFFKPLTSSNKKLKLGSISNILRSTRLLSGIEHELT